MNTKVSDILRTVKHFKLRFYHQTYVSGISVFSALLFYSVDNVSHLRFNSCYLQLIVYIRTKKIIVAYCYLFHLIYRNFLKKFLLFCCYSSLSARHVLLSQTAFTSYKTSKLNCWVNEVICKKSGYKNVNILCTNLMI